MSVLYIGIAGVSRSGKDSFALDLQNMICNYKGCMVYRTALADPLKGDCKNFIKKYLGLDVFTDNTEEKAIFREFLVWYGKVKRQQSEGTYWTSLLDQRVKKFNPDVCIVSDIRYQQYDNDEVHWLKSKPQNILIHLQRATIKGEIVPPANMDESINDSILQSYADYKIVWPTFSENRKYDGMKEIVKKTFNSIIKHRL